MLFKNTGMFSNVPTHKITTAHKYLNAMKTCHQHAVSQYTQRGYAYIEEQTDTNSLLHLNANSA